MYPVVDESVCVNCGACVKHCPVMTPPHSDGVQNVYASKYCDTQKAKESTSGGIFIPLAKSTLEKGGVVFGCAYDENLVARHIAVEKRLTCTNCKVQNMFRATFPAFTAM